MPAVNPAFNPLLRPLPLQTMREAAEQLPGRVPQPGSPNKRRYCLCLYLYLNPSALQKALEQQPDASEVARKMAQLQLAAGDARGNHRCCGFEWGLDCHLPHLAWLVGSYSGRWQ